MKKTFFKNLFRDIKNTISRFLSIVVIIAVGVSFYAGVRATSPDMKMSGDYYFNKNNFMDFKIISTLGLTKDDLSEIKKQKGVKKAEGSYSIDAVIEKDKQSLVLNINSLPEEDGINNIRITGGRKPKSNNEVIVEDRFLKENKLKLNDKIILKSGNDSNLGDSLNNTEFKIVGTAKSPLYISEQRQLSSVGNGSVKGFVYVLPKVFKSPVYTEIYVKTDNEQSKESLLNNESYNDFNKDIEKALKDIKKSQWYVLGRSTNVGYETYRQDSNRIDNIGKAFPFIFFLVAALVSLTTMTRMVQEKRIEIGTFKALGYSRVSIVAHYLIYALSASLIGSLIGILIGFRLFPPLIMNAYSSLYAIPDSVTPFNTGLAFQASILAILFTATAAVAATLEELREVPASLMRPKPPKSGKEILLERITFIWRRLSFTKKVTARNIFRYKQRLFMTVIGIAACTGLMITGFGLKEGIIGATERQFGEIYKYHMQGTLIKNIDDGEKNYIKEKILNKDNVKSVLFTYSKNATTEKKDSKNEDIYVVVPEDKDKFNSYINLSMDDKAINISDEGVVITEKLSKLTNKKVGDNIIINLNDKNIKVKIAAITEQYIQHYVYMSPEYYKKVTGDRVEFNSFYGLFNDTSRISENNLAKDLKGIKKINSVGFKNNIYMDYNKSIESVNTVVLVLIVSAGVLAFVVIYNLTNININERRRELATIKLLGFYNNELANYIYRENIILTLIGSLVGIFMGILLHRFIIITAETNIIMFLRKISPIYFLYSFLLTMVFSIVVNLAMYKRFDKIDMIESLKSAE